MLTTPYDRGRLAGSGTRLGVRNILDQDPPLTDENLSFKASLHDSTRAVTGTFLCALRFNQHKPDI